LAFGIWDLTFMLYFFLLLTPPPAPACVLWIDHPPVANDYLPPICPVELMLPWSYYNLRLIDGNGELICEVSAADHLNSIPCHPNPENNYHVEVWLKGKISTHCNVWLDRPDIYQNDIASQCPEWLHAYQMGWLEIRGPFEIHPPVPVETACTLPQVDNSAPISTNIDYQFLTGRLSWWGIDISPLDWQNRFDEKIRGAADAAGVPAWLLKSMLAAESQFWPLWSGDKGEQGWMQLTWDGADTALRHDPELFKHYCNLGIWLPYCTGYDQLTDDQRNLVKSALVADLAVSGTPLQAADQAASDLWIYAHILRAYACQAEELYPDRDVWQSAAVIYNAGSACISGGVICPQGQKYLEEVMR
jgi:hypothetical protein